MSSLAKNIMTPFIMVSALIAAGFVGYIMVGILGIFLKLSGSI